jgi:hypothetical protein
MAAMNIARRYRTALVIESGLTTAGYGPLVVPWLTGYVAARGAGELADVVAWIVVGIVAALIAWYPERTLIDE